MMDNTNVHLLVEVMDTVAVSMYYIHSGNRDDNVVVVVVDGDDDACLLS